MNFTIIEKQKYSTPVVEQITFDNEISLALESTPPVFESKNGMHAPEYFNNDYFKTNIG